MNWKLFTSNESVPEPVLQSFDFESKHVAMTAAYLCCAHMLHMNVQYIEGPNGERIGESEIQAWCLRKAGENSGDLRERAG
jgi:hypothetical protein